MTDHPIFNVREDDYSFQMTSPISQRFFLRLTSRSGDKEMTFSDFLIESDDDELAVQALHELENHYGKPQPHMTLRFLDIYPSYQETGDQNELTRRHERIVGVLQIYLESIAVNVEKTYLVQRAGKFETVVVTI